MKIKEADDDDGSRWLPKAPRHKTNMVSVATRHDDDDGNRYYNFGTMKANLGLNEECLTDEQKELYGE